MCGSGCVCVCRFLWVLVALGAVCAGVDLQSSVGSGRAGFRAVIECKCVRACVYGAVC